MQYLKTSLSAIVAAALLTACGGADEAPKAAANPLSADVAQPPQAAAAWAPTGAGLMEWAEATYPQYFPAGPLDRVQSPYTYRYYPQTGSYLAVTGEGVYIHGAVAGGRLTRVGALTDFTCQINPYACVPVAAQVVLPPVNTTPAASPAAFLEGVTAALGVTRRVDAQLMVGQQMNTVTLVGAAHGSAQLLAGRSVSFILEDPHVLFNSPPGMNQGTTSASLFLNTNIFTTEGLREGNLKLYVCLDAGCRTQAVGSPLIVPYRVSVVAGVATDVQNVRVQSSFGEVPSPRTVQVTLPQGTNGWGAAWSGGSLRVQIKTSNQMGNVAGKVTLSFPPAPPGSYGDTIRISGTMSDPYTGVDRAFSTDIRTDYTVVDNPAVDAAIAPSETRASLTQADTQPAPSYPRSEVVRAGVTLANRGVEYLTWPAAANPTQRTYGWWDDTTAKAVPCLRGDCLPAGTYTARVIYSVAKGTATTSLYHPITLQIYP